jgi:amino acid transporter
MSAESAAPGPAGHGKLGETRLRLPDVVAQSFGFMGPVFGVAFLLPLIVGAGASGQGAGVATPVAVVIAAAGTLGIAHVIARYARRIHACGALYDYISSAAGRRAGVVAGWVYYGAAVFGFAVSTPLIVAGTLSDWLASEHNVHIAWWVIAIVISVLVFGVVSVGVRVSTRAQLVLVAVSAAVVLGFSVWIIIKGGASGNSLKPFNPASSSLKGILFGVVYGIALFIGFETAANLAEECEQPKVAIPRALTFSIMASAGYFVVCAYAQAIGFGLDAKAWAASGAPLFVLSGDPRFGSSALSGVMVVLVVIDGLAVTIGAWVATTRGILQLARNRVIPAPLGHTYRRFGTPVRAAALVAVITIAIVAIMHLTHGVFSTATADPKVSLPEYTPFWTWLATLGPFLFIVVYLAICVIGVWDLRNSGRRGLLVVAGTVGALVSAGGIFGLIYKAPSPLNWVAPVGLAWLLIGVGITVWLKRTGRLGQDGTLLEETPSDEPPRPTPATA